jgi:hypothetical protein
LASLAARTRLQGSARAIRCDVRRCGSAGASTRRMTYRTNRGATLSLICGPGFIGPLAVGLMLDLAGGDGVLGCGFAFDDTLLRCRGAGVIMGRITHPFTCAWRPISASRQRAKSEEHPPGMAFPPPQSSAPPGARGGAFTGLLMDHQNQRGQVKAWRGLSSFNERRRGECKRRRLDESLEGIGLHQWRRR